MKIGLITQEPVLRASFRALSGDVTAAASAGVKRRKAGEEVVPFPRSSVAEVGQMSRMSVAAGAVMVTVAPVRA